MVRWFYILGWFPTAAAIFGNSLVVYIITTRKRLHNTPNSFVISLAAADICVGIFYFPTHFFCRYIIVPCNEIGHDIAVLTIYLSVSNLCFMTMDRYVAIVWPMRYTALMTSRRVAALVALAWMFPTALDFLPALCARLGKYDIATRTTVVIRLVFLEILPCLFLLITTVQMIGTAKRHTRQNKLLESQLRFNQPNRRQARETASSARVIVIVVSIFLACFCVELYSTLSFVAHASNPSEEIRNVIYFLVVVNSAANPIAYALFKKDIQTELSALLRRPVLRLRRV